MVSTFVSSNNSYMRESLWVIGVNFIFACFSITFWTLLGKFLRKFATNEKFIKIFNYVMSFLLISCIATFYLEL
jgi:threonine/homoserine/homoserine lactone efflux protein